MITLVLLVALALLSGGRLRADPVPTSLTIRPHGSDAVGLPLFLLEWNAISNAAYRVQSSSDLGATDGWKTVEVVKPTTGLGQAIVSFTHSDQFVPQLNNPGASFFRLILPQPQIFAVEPAVFPPGVATELFIVGQCFASNDVVRVDGVPVSGVVFVNNGLLQFTCPPQTEGEHLLELVRGGVVTVTVRVRVPSVSSSLQGPPSQPPASPSGLHLNPYYVENNLAGAMPGGHGRDMILGGGWGDEDADNDGIPDIVEDMARQLPAPVSHVRVDAWASVVEMTTGGGGVSPFSGEVQLGVADLAIPGRGLDFIWARTYNSRIGRTGAPNGWTFSYDVNIQPLGGDLLIRDGTGREDLFKPDTNGVYTCPEFFSEGTLSNTVFKLTFADTGYWEFKPLTASAVAGKLAKIVDRNGNTMTLNYDGAGKLSQVVDDLGRTNIVAYDTSGRIASVTDFSGRTVRYEYDTNGDLVSVISPPVTGTPNGNDFPGGKTNSYTYSSGYLDDRENHLLLTVKDATGTITHKHVYQHNQTDFEFLRCTSMQHWTNTPTMISYLPQTPTPENQFATLRCVVNNPVGDAMEYFFDSRNRPVKLQEFTGRATPGVRVTASVNRPTGKLRSSDPDAYETRWTWNNDSLCTLEVGPGGQQMQYVYESDFDKSTRARKRADCRVVREIASSPMDLDGDGVAETTERVSRFEYDPRFGSDLTSRHFKKPFSGNSAHSSGRSRLRSGVIAEVGAGRPATVGRESATVLRGVSTRGVRLTAKPAGNVTISLSFVTSATDPRGNVTTGEYDPNGNLIETAFGRSNVVLENLTPTEYTAHNSHGQLTAITNAPDANGFRRVDTFSYYSNGPQAGYLQSCVVDAGAGGLALTQTYEYDARGNLTRVTDPRGNDWLYSYSALDQLVQTESALLSGGSTGTYRIKTQFSYDANDNLALVAEENRDANGTLGTNPFWRTQFVYDGAQRLTGCWRDKNGALVLRCTEVAYNAANQVILYRSPEAVNGNDSFKMVAFEYDERGLDYRAIAAPGSPAQSTTQCDYDPNGLVTRVSEGLEDTPGVTTMEYDGFAGFGSASSLSQARQTRFEEAVRTENVRSRLRSEVSSLQFEHGNMDRPVVLGSVWGSSSSPQIKGAAGHRDNWGIKGGSALISKITDPMGNVTTFNYDANDNLKVARHFGQMNDVPGSIDNIRLAESRYEYDGLDRPVRSRDLFFSLPSQAPIGDGERITTFACAPNGQCTSVTDDLGRATSYAYDTAGRFSSVSSPGSKSVTVSYRDVAGNPTSTTQTDLSDLGGPLQVFAWTNVYDSLNRCVSTTDNVGNSSSFAYDSRGNRVRSTDPNGNVTTYAYDGISRPVSSTSYQGATTSIVSSSQFAFDDNDRCTSSTDANGNVTLHTYDSRDRLTQTTQADGTHHTLVWSPRSNLIQETDANGTVINRIYDLNDRCISSNITPGGGVATTTTFETFAYNGRSQLVAATNDVFQNMFEYDSLGSRTRGVSGGVGAVVTPRDSVGNRLSMTYPGGRVLTYAYDALDQCTSINENGAPLASFSYAGPGRVARVIYGNGTSTQVTYDGLSGTPNAQDDFGQGMISSVTHAVPGTTGPQSFAAVNLKWDRNGNKTLRNDTIFAPAIPRTNTLGLQYDAANRLTGATVSSGPTVLRDTIYNLDAMGNRTQVSGAAGCSGAYVMDGQVPGPLDLQMNQYTTTPCDARTYDANGNLVSRGPATYQYDYAGRLVLVQSPDINSGALAPVASYAYDALGRRVSKTISSGSLPPVTTQFIYDGDDPIETREYGALIDSFVHRVEDRYLIGLRHANQDYYYHTDDQGNVLALSSANGAVVERYDYDDYGKVTFLTSDGIPTSATSSSVGNPYCWQGLRLDAETGLLNDDGGVYHEPQSGRVITVPWIPSNPSIPHGTAAGNNPWSDGGSLGASGGMKGGWLGSNGGSNDFESDDDVNKKTDKSEHARAKKRQDLTLRLANTVEQAEAERKLREKAKIFGPKFPSGRGALRSPSGSN